MAVQDLLGKGYLGNKKLRRPGQKIPWTTEQMVEFMKCKDDPLYFMEKYIKIMHPDRGVISFVPREFQKEIVKSFIDNRYTCISACRQAGKSTAMAASVLHYIIFNSAKTVAMLANKGETAREILKRIQFAYENLPKWMQHGVVEYNKGSFELENESRVLAAASSASAIRGYSISALVLDECAHLDNWDEFFTSVYPTISSGTETKIVMVSTPNGYNHFHAFWTDANTNRNANGLGINEFYPIQVTWRDIPERNNPQWEARERRILGDTKFEQEHECVAGDTTVTIKDNQGVIREITIKQLKLELEH